MSEIIDEDVIDLVKLINERSSDSLFACDEENKTLLHLVLATGNDEMSNFLFDEMKNNKVIYTKDHELKTVFWTCIINNFAFQCWQVIYKISITINITAKKYY